MPQTRTFCPRCRQPVMADVNQLFDVSANPAVKQDFLSGRFNLISCPSCGYEGNLATPLVYHDNSKELLLTYFPPELGLPVNEQERLVGPLLKQVMDHLPQEQRKAYLLRPQNMLTLQTMVERVLEADGITREMIQAQQQRLALLQRLLTAAPDARVELVKNEQNLVDESLFVMLGRLIEASAQSGDEQSARAFIEVQQVLLDHSTFGQQIRSQSEEADAAMRSLQEAQQKGLTREGLLDLMIEAPTETRLNTLVNVARSGMDYAFFQILSDRINQANDADRPKLEGLRDKLVDMTQAIDKEIQAQVEQTRGLLEELAAAEDPEQATMQNLQAINQLFVQLLQGEIQQARAGADLDRLARLNKILSVLQRVSAPPPEYQLIEELLSAPGEAERRQVLDQNRDKITQEFLDLLNGLIGQSQAENGDPELVAQLQAVHKQVLRFSMEMNLQK